MVLDSRRNATSSKNVSEVARDPNGTVDDHSRVRLLRGLDKVSKSIDALIRVKAAEFVNVAGNDDGVVNVVIKLLHLENPDELFIKCPLKLDRAADKTNDTFHQLFYGRGGVRRKLFR